MYSSFGKSEGCHSKAANQHCVAERKPLPCMSDFGIFITPVMGERPGLPFARLSPIRPSEDEPLAPLVPHSISLFRAFHLSI